MIDRDIFARALAHADAEVQASFLNDFCDELAIACRKSYIGDQTYYLAEFLRPQSVEILKEITSDFDRHEQRSRERELEIREKREELFRLDREIAAKRAALED